MQKLGNVTEITELDLSHRISYHTTVDHWMSSIYINTHPAMNYDLVSRSRSCKSLNWHPHTKICPVIGMYTVSKVSDCIGIIKLITVSSK